MFDMSVKADHSGRVQPVALHVLLRHYLFAFLAVALMTAGLFFLSDVLSAPIIALLYLLPVLVSATQWGLGAGVTASVCAFLAFDYFFIEPLSKLLPHQTQDILILLVFLIVAVVGSHLVGQVQSSLLEIRMREWEVARLYELSGALAGLRGEENIARLLAERTHGTFRAEFLRLTLQANQPHPRLVLSVPTGAILPSEPPRVVITLASTDRVIGRIEMWRLLPLDSREDRMLRTFAEQGSLALERAMLVQTETRARILEESERLQSALFSSVSHELRTPLATIKAAVTSLSTKAVDWSSPASDELLAALEAETDRLNQLVANLLNMSRLEAGALKLQRGWNVLAEVIDTTISQMTKAASQHRLEVDASVDLPLVSVDAGLIQQVFANLVSNGLKYGPPSTTIRIQADEQDDETLLIQVTNEGPHVPEEDLERIFERFYRATRDERVTGIGLGLSICKGIVEAHGGRIWAENLVGGFAFKFTLPTTLDGTPGPRLSEDME
jgi:two-component system sensor histidine kinase KdpD